MLLEITLFSNGKKNPKKQILVNKHWFEMFGFVRYKQVEETKALGHDEVSQYILYLTKVFFNPLKSSAM